MRSVRSILSGVQNYEGANTYPARVTAVVAPIGFGAGTGALPLRKIVVLMITELVF